MRLATGSGSLHNLIANEQSQHNPKETVLT
jgi:hypothetical protein